MLEWLTNDAFGVMILALLRNVIYLIVALVILFSLMDNLFKFMNKSVGLDSWKIAVWENIKDDPNAVALYFGLRALGVIIACGIITSSFLR